MSEYDLNCPYCHKPFNVSFHYGIEYPTSPQGHEKVVTCKDCGKKFEICSWITHEYCAREWELES